jgi:hypothetical protein
VEVQVLPWKMLIVMQMVNATPIEGARPPDQAVHLIPLVEQLLGHVRAILTGHTGDQRSSGFRHVIPPHRKSSPQLILLRTWSSLIVRIG